MALPGTFLVSEAVDEAFERCGVDPGALVDKHLESAARSIRLLLDEWNTDSVDFWKILSGQQHITTIEEQQFVLPDGAIDILRMGVLRYSYLTPLLIIAAEDWFALPDKGLAQGMAQRMWAERLIAGVTAHYYPMAENNTDILLYDVMMQFNDSTILQGSPDVPPAWQWAFVDGLTAYLAEKYDRPNYMAKLAKYGGPMIPTGSYARARAGNRERGDTVLIKHPARRLRR